MYPLFASNYFLLLLLAIIAFEWINHDCDALAGANAEEEVADDPEAKRLQAKAHKNDEKSVNWCPIKEPYCISVGPCAPVCILCWSSKLLCRMEILITSRDPTSLAAKQQPAAKKSDTRCYGNIRRKEV